MKREWSIVIGSLSAVARQSGRSVAESFIGCDVVIICDVSGSMATEDARGGKSRYEVALEELAKLQARMPGKLAIIAFSDRAFFMPGGQLPPIGSNTDLAAALRLAKIADVGGMRFTIISDGMPDSEEEAMVIVRTFKNRIDTIFVGPEDDYEGGREFLTQLAQASGGQNVTAAYVSGLADSVTLLLAN